MRIITIACFCFMAQSLALANLEPINPVDLPYYRQIFPTATSLMRLTVADPITEGSPNREILQLFDEGSKMVGYVRDIATDTGCESLCKLLDFTLAYLPDGSFAGLISREPLTKTGHALFTPDDYTKLNQVLTHAPVSYLKARQPKDMVDAVTRATLPVFQPDVVGGAAFTCYRSHQYNEQTSLFLKRYPSAALDFSLPDLRETPVLFSYTDPASSFKNKVTVLIFFGSWCSTCKRELPYVEQLFQKFKNNTDVKIVAVRTSRSRETENIHDFVRRLGLNFLIVSDTDKFNPPASRVAKMYGIAYLPTTFVLRRDGTIAAVPEFTNDEYVAKMSKIIENLL